MKTWAGFLFLLLAFDLVSTSPTSWKRFDYDTGNRYPWDEFRSESDSEEAEYFYDGMTSTPESTTPMTKVTKSTTKTELTTTPTSTLQPTPKSTPAHETDADLIAMLGKMAADFILNGTDHQTANSSKQTPKTKSTIAEKTDADMIAAFVNEMVAALMDELDHQPAKNSKQTPKSESTVAEKTDADLIGAFLKEMVAVALDELDHPTNSSTQRPNFESTLAEKTDADMIAAFMNEMVAALMDELDHPTNSSTQTPKSGSSVAEQTDADMIAALVKEVVAVAIHEIDHQANSSTQTAHPKSESDTNMIGGLVNEVSAAVLEIDNQIDKSMLTSLKAKKTEQEKQVPATETRHDQFNPNCDLIQDYDIHQYHRQDHESWSVSFNLKNALRRAMFQIEAPSHYIVRYQKTDKITVGEMQFLVVPANHRQNKIAVENLSPSVYDFQICAISASFKPSFLDESSFSWVKEARIHRLRLQSGSEEQTEAESTFGEKSEYPW